MAKVDGVQLGRLSTQSAVEKNQASVARATQKLNESTTKTEVFRQNCKDEIYTYPKGKGK